MATQWLRRAWLLAGCASAALLAACGGGSINEPFYPTAVYAIGDATADLGEKGYRYTVNDGTVNIWTERVAAQYGLSLTTANSYAQGSARVLAKPDPAGDSTTPTIQEQVDALIASGAGRGAKDLVLVSAGTADVIAEVQAVINNTQSATQAAANAGQEGRDLAAQIQRLVAAGVKHIAVAGPYKMGRSPWAIKYGQQATVNNVVRQFNDQLVVTMGNMNLGNNVLVLPMEAQFDYIIGNPGGYGFSNATDPVCTSTGTNIGIGTDIDSTQCNSGTLAGDPNTYVFADRVYLSPGAQRWFGDFAFPRIRDRW